MVGMANAEGTDVHTPSLLAHDRVPQRRGVAGPLDPVPGRLWPLVRVGIRVEPSTGGRLPPRRALLRFVGLTLAALPLFAGFLMILVDDRRRGLQDRIARTVVVEAADETPG